MTAGWRELTLKEILYGVAVPLIVGLMIIAFPLSQPLLMGTNPALIGILVFGIMEVVLIVAVPCFWGHSGINGLAEPQDFYSAASMPYGTTTDSC